jgi:hypothetical protein
MTAPALRPVRFTHRRENSIAYPFLDGHGTLRSRMWRRMSTSVLLGLVLGSTTASAQAGPTVGLCTHFAVLVPCESFVQHPAVLGFGSDGRVVVLHLHWSRWGSASTTAHGTLRADGGPAGHPEYTTSPATLIASHIGRCRGRRVYLRLEVHSRAIPGGAVYRGCIPR